MSLDEWQEPVFNEALKGMANMVVEFSAPWCHACKLTEPIVAEVSKSYTDIQFAKIDVAKNPALASKMGVMSLPNIFFIKAGKVKDQIIGAASRVKIEEKMRALAN